MSRISSDLFFNLKGEYIHMQFLGDDNIVFTKKENIFKENAGLVIENPQPKIPVYYVTLSDFGDKLLCGNIADMLFAGLLSIDVDNIILVLDFADVLEINQSFCEEYLKHLLTTKNKIISINKNRQVMRAFSEYILDNIKDAQEPEVKEIEEEDEDD